MLLYPSPTPPLCEEQLVVPIVGEITKSMAQRCLDNLCALGQSVKGIRVQWFVELVWPFLPTQGQLGGAKARPWDCSRWTQAFGPSGSDENILGFVVIR